MGRDGATGCAGLVLTPTVPLTLPVPAADAVVTAEERTLDSPPLTAGTMAPGGDRDGQDERTPLLKRGSTHNSNAGSANGDADSQHSSSSGDATVVTDLGDWTLEPSLLTRAVADKDLDALLDKSGGSRDDAVGALCKALQTDPEQGLEKDQVSQEGAKERVRVYGRNQLPTRQLKSFWKFVWDAFNDKVLIILSSGLLHSLCKAYR